MKNETKVEKNNKYFDKFKPLYFDFQFFIRVFRMIYLKRFLCRCCAILNMGIPQKLFCDLPSFAYICIEELLEEKKRLEK